MRSKDKRTEELNSDTNNEAVVEDFHRTWLKRILHTTCLFLPICAAFAGYFISKPLGNMIFKDVIPEIFKFGVTIFCFAVTTTIIFIATRKENPIMKIMILNKKN